MFRNLENQRVPSTTFKTRRDHEWVERSSEDVFAGKSVIVFSLPGAFTPTCSSSHVPRYNQLEPLFKANGIDEVICVSVNDAFVMEEWRCSQNADRIAFLPDGNGEFTNGMGMLVDKDDLGFGKRSWRYSMLVRDGVIEKMFTYLVPFLYREPGRGHEEREYEIAVALRQVLHLGFKHPGSTAGK